MRHRFIGAVAFAFVAVLVMSLIVHSPAPAATVSGSATLTAKIIAIDHGNRIVTLQDDQGNVQSIHAGSGVKRFDELKVGETVVFNYTASLATAIAKPGTAMPSASSSPTITRFTGEKPGGQISETVTATVTVKAIDPAAPSITIVTQGGRTLSLLVQNKDNLTGLKAGDVVQITYTQTLTITVK